MRIFIGKEFLADDHDIVAIIRADSVCAIRLKRDAIKTGRLVKITNGKKEGEFARIEK